MEKQPFFSALSSLNIAPWSSSQLYVLTDSYFLSLTGLQCHGIDDKNWVIYVFSFLRITFTARKIEGELHRASYSKLSFL